MSQLSSLVEDVAIAMQEILGEKNLAFDVKIHHLQPEQIPCIPGWHCDGTHPLDEYVDEYCIWYAGGPGTEFMLSEVELDIDRSFPQGKLYTLLKEDPQDFKSVYDTITLEPKTIYRYNKFNFHRGDVSTRTQDRLLIRGWKTKSSKRDDVPFTVSTHRHISLARLRGDILG